MSKVRIGDLMQRRKELIRIEDEVIYKQVTIRTKHKGVVLRGTQKGATIGTKNQYITHQDQFILSCIDARNGAFGIVPSELEGAIITNDFWCFDINEQLVLRDFFYTLIQAPDFDDACKKASIGTTNRQRINADFFLNYELEIPPIEEQADAVRQILAAQQHTKLIEAELIQQATLLIRIRQAILREAVQGRLLPQNPADESGLVLLARIQSEKQRLVNQKKIWAEKPLLPLPESAIPYALPQGWVWCRLSDVCRIINGRAYKKEELLDAGTPVLRVGNLFTSTKWYYSNLILEEDKYCQNGDLIYAWSASFGPRIWDGPRAIYHYHIWKLDYTSGVDRDFLFYLLQNETEAIKAESKGVAMLHMTKESMDKKPIPLPPLAEQRRIVAKVAELLAHCTELEAELSRARTAASALHAAALREAFQPVAAMMTAN